MKIVDKFCCGCDLKTGAIIIGVVHLLMGIPTTTTIHLLMSITSASVGIAELSGNLWSRHVIIIAGTGNTATAYGHVSREVATYAVIMGAADILPAISPAVRNHEEGP